MTGALLAPLPLLAETGAAAPLPIDPARQVYAFDEPAILVHQIVFGLAHGVTLLARACLDAGEDLRPPTQAIYEEWLLHFGDRIIDAEQGLARHYFGPRANEATEEDLARALNLPATLDLNKTPERLREACASFPEALARPRYDLDLVFATHRDEQRLGRAIEVRAAVGQCREIASADAVADIDAAMAEWEAANGAAAAAAREHWLEYNGDADDLRHWQDALTQAIRRRLAAGTVDSESACRKLIAGLAKPENALAGVMSDGLPPAVPPPTPAR